MAKEQKPEPKTYDELVQTIEQEENFEKGERHYAREFKRIYVGVRKALVDIQKARNKSISNEVAYDLAKKTLSKYL